MNLFASACWWRVPPPACETFLLPLSPQPFLPLISAKRNPEQTDLNFRTSTCIIVPPVCFGGNWQLEEGYHHRPVPLRKDGLVGEALKAIRLSTRLAGNTIVWVRKRSATHQFSVARVLTCECVLEDGTEPKVWAECCCFVVWMHFGLGAVNQSEDRQCPSHAVIFPSVRVSTSCARKFALVSSPKLFSLRAFSHGIPCMTLEGLYQGAMDGL